MSEQVIQEVLDFWFDAANKKRWFRSTPEFDKDIRERFEPIYKKAMGGGCDHWLETADGALALCIVLDQFPLNMYRGQIESYWGQPKAAEISKRAIEQGLDLLLPKDRVAFLYMPLMHSEHLADHDQSVQLFATAGLTENHRFARHHRDIIKRFGRFPHRNKTLGRESTEEEIEWLNTKGSFKG